MIDEILTEIHAVSYNLNRAIMRTPVLDRARRLFSVTLVTDTAFTAADKARAQEIIRKYVPAYFDLSVEISKLTPDCEMVRRKIADAIAATSKAVFATLEGDDISVEKTEDGFRYTIAVAPSLKGSGVCDAVNSYLKKYFCGSFDGVCVVSSRSLETLEVEETHDEPEFETPVRTFPIEDFAILEGEKIEDTAVYLSDLNFVSEDVVICGVIEDIRERSYTNKNGQERSYYNFILNDGTATLQITYFIRRKSADKIAKLKAGDSIVCTGSNEEFRGNLRYTARTIDYGRQPRDFVPEKKQSKPVPVYYHAVQPQPFADTEQTDLFAPRALPQCLKERSFVVFDLETTGLNSSPVTGNMDRIIEIGAFKIENGEITQSFSTFVNPERKLSDEIVSLTGITPAMVENAPTYAKVMPDFFKFCAGSVLVGHNVAGFDFKFVDYYCSRLGYMLERNLIDTIPLAQELLYLPNYKLNTVAEKFGITFNHHRAIDDALATAKIFIELIKMKKSLPQLR